MGLVIPPFEEVQAIQNKYSRSGGKMYGGEVTPFIYLGLEDQIWLIGNKSTLYYFTSAPAAPPKLLYALPSLLFLLH